MRLKLRATRRVMIHKTAMSVTETLEYTLCPIPMLESRTILATKDPAQAYLAWISKRPKSEAHIRGVKSFIMQCEKDSFYIEWVVE